MPRLSPAQADAAFGYRLGEERRYVLEPLRSLRPGESAWWSIVLGDIQGAGEGTRIMFELAHERTVLIRDIFGGARGRLQTVHVDGRLTVNRFGFPERLVINEQHDVHGETGSMSDVRTTTFRFDGERYVKSVRLNGRDWDFPITIANHDDLDLEGPLGLFAYVPTALRCMGFRGQAGRPVRCAGGDPAFANPGLLSLALPVMWEEQVDERKFLFFKPSGVSTAPSGLIDMSALMQRERNQLDNITRYYDNVELKFEEFVEEIQIGPRKVGAWRLDGGGEMGEFYTDLEGRVLKVEIGPHPITHGERWIRLLYPSEY